MAPRTNECASGQGWAGVPVIDLTADAMSGDRERYLAMGMTGYLSKPLAERDLLSEIARVRDEGVWIPGSFINALIIDEQSTSRGQGSGEPEFEESTTLSLGERSNVRPICGDERSVGKM